ncbi:hypothetical protein NDU88_005816 [Pleurodeles waltl]|uniref:Uncharacterized protein n=1 Tax=Pleurodeles waltl TaxID=8319 RepID=A0AAV7TV08_PLEWA|nr:hypothetical protein NDU88_005816 [Pleurodeles waltl]
MNTDRSRRKGETVEACYRLAPVAQQNLKRDASSQDNEEEKVTDDKKETTLGPHVKKQQLEPKQKTGNTMGITNPPTLSQDVQENDTQRSKAPKQGRPNRKHHKDMHQKRAHKGIDENPCMFPFHLVVRSAMKQPDPQNSRSILTNTCIAFREKQPNQAQAQNHHQGPEEQPRQPAPSQK